MRICTISLQVAIWSMLYCLPVSSQGLSGDDMLRSIVYIECEDLGVSDVEIVGDAHRHVRRPIYKGTGVLINSRGDLITAKHVVPGAAENYQNTRCRGIRGTGARLPVRFLIPRLPHPSYDAMVLSFVRDPSEVFKAPAYVTLDQVNERMPIFARGFPGGAYATGEVSHREGRISTFTPDIRGFIGTTGMSSAGMSGGPVFLETGEVVGIVAGADFGADGSVSQYAVLAFERVGDWASAKKSTLTGEPTDTVSGSGEVQPTAISAQELENLSAAEAAQRSDDNLIPFSVIGEDNRIAVLNTTEFPASAVVQLTLENQSGQLTSCSGAMIAADMVLTTAHCLVQGKTPWSKITVFPARSIATLPFGKCGAKEVFVMEEWRSSAPLAERLGANLGAIRLDCDVGNLTGWFGLSIGDQLEPGSQIRILSYPGDKSPSGRQWESPGEVQGTKDGLLLYDAFTSGGASGGPILGADGKAIFAVHAYGASGDISYRSGIALTPDKIRLIKEWIERDRKAVADASILRISCEAEDGGIRFGTGFFADAEGTVVTQAHVVREATNCTAATGKSNAASYRLHTTRVDDNGVAVMKYGGPLNNIQAITVERFFGPKIGQTVEAFGFDGIESPVAGLRRGYLSGLSPDRGEMRFDMNVSRGMSGAPVVDESNQLVAMISGVSYDPWGSVLSTIGLPVNAIVDALAN